MCLLMEESMIDFSIRSCTHIVLLYTAKILVTHAHTPHTHPTHTHHITHTHTHTPIPTHTHTHTHTTPTGTRQTSVLVVKLHLQLYEMYTQEHNLLDFKTVTWPHTNFNLLAY